MNLSYTPSPCNVRTMFLIGTEPRPSQRKQRCDIFKYYVITHRRIYTHIAHFMEINKHAHLKKITKGTLKAILTSHNFYSTFAAIS